MPPKRLHDIDVTPEQERLLEQLARREHEEREAESRLMERFGKRAEVASKLWAAIVAIVVFACVATAWVWTIKLSTDRNAAEIDKVWEFTRKNRELVGELKVELKDKADRK